MNSIPSVPLHYIHILYVLPPLRPFQISWETLPLLGVVVFYGAGMLTKPDPRFLVAAIAIILSQLWRSAVIL